MKKHILTALLIAVVAIAEGQTIENLSPLPLVEQIQPSSNNWRTIELPKQYKDTLNCMIRIIDKTGFYVDKWVRAKVVLKDGGLHNENMRTTWTNEYIAFAIGPFTNKFITEYDLSIYYVMQVSIIDKNPYKQ